MKPTHFRPHVERNPLSFSDDPFDPWRLRTSRAGESRSPRAVGNLPAKRSASQDSTNGPTILGLSAETLEGVEVGFGDCPARDRLNDGHLRRILKSYFRYYHESRTHLSLDKDAPASREIQPNRLERIVHIPQVGGLHHRYERRAA